MEAISQLADEFDENLTLDLAGKQETELKHQQHEDEDHDDEDDDDESEDDEFEFFVGGGDLNSPVSAEEVFENGQIRPIFPFSDENSDEATTSSCGPPVKKLFVVSDDVAEGPYCTWSTEKSSTPAPAPEMSQKSNSTGFSKLWRVRDLLVRSHSDGKDAFVFLTGKGDDQQKVGTTPLEKKEKKKKVVNVSKLKIGNQSETVSCNKEKKGKGKKQQSAYEVLYGKKEKKAGKSYLPYRQDLVGFFTNANGGMSRNVHPY